MRMSICPATLFVLASITVMESLCAFETYTRSAVATTPEGLLPPSVPSPNGMPVWMNVSILGAAGSARSTTASELASRTLGSPRPGTSTGPLPVSRRTPASDSGEGNPKAGNGRPVPRRSWASTPGTAWYSNMPTFVT